MGEFGGGGNTVSERAYETWAAKFPNLAEKGSYLDRPCDKSSVIERFETLGQLVGVEAAQEMVEKEPSILLQTSDKTRGSFEYLRDLETADNPGEALSIVLKNPNILTVGAFEFARVKTKLSDLSFSATVIDILRPLGPLGLAVVIFGSFVLLILVLRPLLYGVGGGKSVASILLDPVSSVLSFPNPREILESNGISPAVLILPIPLYQVFSAFKNKLGK